MLELMGVGPVEEGIDLSEVAEIDDIGELAVDEKMIAETRLEELEDMLEEQPDNGNLWQEKGEVLDQLGRHEEAMAMWRASLIAWIMVICGMARCPPDEGARP